MKILKRAKISSKQRKIYDCIVQNDAAGLAWDCTPGVTSKMMGTVANMSVREITPEELTFLKLKFKWGDVSIRMHFAYRGVALNVLVNDKSADVRKAVAATGYGHKQLQFDSDPEVRRLVENYEELKAYAKAKSIVDGMFRETGHI